MHNELTVHIPVQGRRSRHSNFIPTKLISLLEPDKEKHVAYCEWFQRMVRQQDNVLDVMVFFTDEAWFHLSGHVNSQNTRLWISEQPYAMHERPLHSVKIGVWCAASRQRIIGPIFLLKNSKLRTLHQHNP